MMIAWPVALLLSAAQAGNSACVPIKPTPMAINFGVGAERGDLDTVNSNTLIIIGQADLYLRSKGRNKDFVRECALNNILKLAQEEAFLSANSAYDNQYKNWIISAISIAYLKLDPYDKRSARNIQIDRWLLRNADYLKDYFSKRRRRNNHIYWNGVALAAVGQATGKCEFVEASQGLLREGLVQVSEDGTLPEEIRRQSNAVHYHAFAAKALVGIVLLTSPHLDQRQSAALRRLLSATVRGIQGRGPIIDRAGAKQEPEDNLSYLELFAPYLENDDRAYVIRISKIYNGKQMFLGGGLEYLKNFQGKFCF